MSNNDVITVLAEFNAPVPDTPENLRQLQNVYSNNVLDAWEKEGFSNIKPLDKPARKGDLCPAHCAQRGGKPCLILMPPPAPNPMELDGLGDTHCERAEKEFPEWDVYYSSVLLWGVNLVLFLPVKVRSGGEWLTNEIETEQFIPQSRREGGSNFLSAIMGGVHFFKAFNILMPYVAENGRPLTFSITNLFDHKEQGKPYVAVSCSPPPGWMLVLSAPENAKHIEVSHLAFYHDSAPFTELELTGKSKEYRQYGIIQLLHQSGRELQAECLEATLFADALPTGRRYMWSLSMMATDIAPSAREFVIREGPLYEMEKAKYREEHGGEPPADFGVNVTTKGMRAINQEHEGERAALADCFGVVTALEEQAFSPLEIPGGKCLRAQVRCMPDDDDFLLTLYLPPAVLTNYMPKVGDSIMFCGTLCAAPDELCETGESWQDSGEVGAEQEERGRPMQAYQMMSLFQEGSIGLGVAAAAFARAGWELEQAVRDDLFSRKYVPLSMKNQRGETALVFVDTVVDGHEPQLPYTEKRGEIEQFVREEEDIHSCHFCRVHLDYKPEMDRYSVSMEMEPECPGVENALLLTASGFHGTESIMENGEITERRTRPEVLDEAMAARLFRDAMAKGEWAALAKWMREEMTYRSHTVGKEYYGKIDYLRYMAERIDWWKENNAWQDFSFSTGTIPHDGRERPCMALSYQGKITAVTVFDDYRGMIGHMENLPKECFSRYRQETPSISPADEDDDGQE